MPPTIPDFDLSNYDYKESELNQHHACLLPAVRSVLATTDAKRIFEIGFGNGSVANYLTKLGYDVTGIEPSSSGVALARQAYPRLTKLVQGDIYADLAEHVGKFPLVLSLDVIEHVYFPRRFAAAAFALLDFGGLLILSTPYHGYMKNLALALAGKFDFHFTALWDHGHIKFWSIRTLTTLLEEAGFEIVQFKRVGRFPPIAKSMIAVARKPSKPLKNTAAG